MLDKLKNVLPALGPFMGLMGFGQIQGVVVGAALLLAGLVGMKFGINIGFRDGYKEGQKSCEREEEEGGRRRFWPWREGLEEIDLEPFEAAVPIQ